MQLVKVAPPLERKRRIVGAQPIALFQNGSQETIVNEVLKDKSKAGRRSGADYRLVRRRLY